MVCALATSRGAGTLAGGARARCRWLFGASRRGALARRHATPKPQGLALPTALPSETSAIAGRIRHGAWPARPAAPASPRRGRRRPRPRAARRVGRRRQALAAQPRRRTSSPTAGPPRVGRRLRQAPRRHRVAPRARRRGERHALSLAHRRLAGDRRRSRRASPRSPSRSTTASSTPRPPTFRADDATTSTTTPSPRVTTP